VFGPGTSVNVHLKVSSANRDAFTPLQRTCETPERTSLAVPVTVSDAVDCCELFAGEAIVRSGAVLSILTLSNSVWELPATSVAVPLAVRVPPSLVSVTGLLTLATPESPSVALKVTVTSELFQPLAFGFGLTTEFRSGSVLSTLTTTDFDAL